jgi:hypothetical protein
MQSVTRITIKKAALVTAIMIAAGPLFLALSGDSFSAAALFTLWVTSPYLVFHVVSTLVERFTQVPGRYTVGVVFAALMLGFTLLAYISTYGDKSSTYGLIFIFVPLWLHVMGVGLYGFCVLISWLVEWSQRRASS